MGAALSFIPKALSFVPKLFGSATSILKHVPKLSGLFKGGGSSGGLL